MLSCIARRGERATGCHTGARRTIALGLLTNRLEIQRTGRLRCSIRIGTGSDDRWRMVEGESAKWSHTSIGGYVRCIGRTSLRCRWCRPIGWVVQLVGLGVNPRWWNGRGIGRTQPQSISLGPSTTQAQTTSMPRGWCSCPFSGTERHVVDDDDSAIQLGSTTVGSTEEEASAKLSPHLKNAPGVSQESYWGEAVVSGG